MKHTPFISIPSIFGLMVSVSLLLALGQFQRLQLTPTIGLYLHDFVIVVAVLFLGARMLTAQPIKPKIAFSFSLKLVVIFCGVVGLGYLNAIFNQLSPVSGLMYLGRLLLYGWFGWLSWQYLHHNSTLLTRSKNRFLWWLIPILPGLLILWFGLLQYTLIPDTRQLFILGWDDHLHRLISTPLDPGYTGAILVLTWIWLARSVALKLQTHTYRWKLLKLMLSGLILLGLSLTFSRASYLMFLGVGSSLWLQQSKRWKTWLTSIAVFLALVAVVPTPAGEGVQLARTSTIQARVSASKSHLAQLQNQDWLIGRGLFTTNLSADTDAPAYHATQADSWLVTLLSGTGFIGLGLSGLIGGLAITWQWRHTPSWAVQSIGLVLFGLFNNVFQPFLVLIWIQTGVVELLFKRDRER